MITMAEAWWQSGRHGIGLVAESLLLIPQDGGRGRDILRLSLLWAFETSKSNTSRSPPTKSHILILTLPTYSPPTVSQTFKYMSIWAHTY